MALPGRRSRTKFNSSGRIPPPQQFSLFLFLSDLSLLKTPYTLKSLPLQSRGQYPS